MADHVIEVGHHPSVCGSGCIHNRWHPHIEPVLRIAPGETVEMETRDASDGQIRPGMSVTEILGMDVGRPHPLTGPLYIEGAEPGDLLAVHIESIVASDHAFTVTLPRRGLMPDLFPGPLLAHWEIENGWATSPQLPGVRIPGAPFMGTIGVAPSMERLRAVNKREEALLKAGALVMPPRIESALPDRPDIAAEAWRTAAAHEVGGNMDIRQLVAGSKAYFPVDVPGALFSVGDGHFAQGDGETCGTALEMATRFTARFELLKGEAIRRGQKNPSFEVKSTETPGIGSHGFYATTGLSVTDNDVVQYLDASLASRNALIAMIDAIAYDYGYSREQAYLIASVAGDLKISSIVNVPYAQASMFLPKSIFLGR